MATTISEITSLLDDAELRYQINEDQQAIAIGFEIDSDSTGYRDSDGDPNVLLVVEIKENGEFLSICGPFAWNVRDCPHQPAVFESLVLYQARCKMIRFDYDPKDGEIRPNVEMPLEDAAITEMQFHRLLGVMLQAIKDADAIISHAMKTGVADPSLITGGRVAAETEADSDIERLRQLAAQAGGVEELEKLLGGDDPPKDSGVT
ncbi:MAG: hypothetical protein EBU59_10695 [Planctomycetia bacterium]|jgi:hypothetical protein|nr:hypothetical protein [Planctomycetia bacterium]